MLFTFLRDNFGSFEILGKSKKFLLYYGESAQYTTDKFLRVMSLHALGSHFCSCSSSAYTTYASYMQ